MRNWDKNTKKGEISQEESWEEGSERKKEAIKQYIKCLVLDFSLRKKTT